MLIALIVFFGIILMLFTPFNTRLRFFFTDVNLALSFSLKIGILPPEFIYSTTIPELIAKDNNEASEQITDSEFGLEQKDIKDLMRYIPLNYAHTLVYFGDKDNAMTTALVLKIMELILVIFQKALPFPKGRITHTLIPEYQKSKIFINSEIRFSTTLFVIFLALYKILKNRGKNYEYKQYQ